MIIPIEVVKTVHGIVRVTVSDLNKVVIPTRFLIGLRAGQEVDLGNVKDCCGDCGKGQPCAARSEGDKLYIRKLPAIKSTA